MSYDHFSFGGVRVAKRTALVGTCMAVAITAIGWVALMRGAYPLGPGDVLRALSDIGLGDVDPLGAYFVGQQRLPRALCAIAVGALLGIAGAIFQRLSGNLLGSPDIIGLSTGAASGAVIAIIVFSGSPAVVALGAIAGGLVVACFIYRLSLQGGKSNTTRLVLVGIGTAAILQALNTLLLVGASLDAAQTASQWLAGSFNATTWTDVAWACGVLILVTPIALLLGRPLAVLMSGDDLAAGLGVNVERRRADLLIVGVIGTCIAVAIAGPISFVALAAPQLPVGVVTGVLGGAYLVWLLSGARRF